ncbi:MAG: oligosaccharide flippase family protein [Candidatus Hadarchaeum sp.]|uniref:oligosaccharide flippase family protein n=1 Tax=Candidatus Hadarchaeum sp. TaxID=2883567 RepID=UPI003173AFF5
MKLQIGRRTLAYNFLNLLAGSLASQGVSTVVLLLTARQLGAEGYGQYTASLALTGSTAVLFNLGLDIWLLRNGAAGLALLSTFVGSVFLIKITLGWVWFLFIQVLLLLLRPENFPGGLVGLAAASVWFNGLLATILTTYKLSLKNRFTFFLQTLYVLIWLALTAALITWNEHLPWAYMWVRTLAIFIVVITGYIMLLKMGFLAPVRIRLATVRTILRETIPFAISDALAWILMRADVLIIALLLDRKDVGVFSTAENIVNMLFFVPAAAYEIFVPTLSYSLKNDVNRAQLFVRYGICLFPLIGLLLILLVWICAPLLTNLLGTDFQEVRELLLILCPVPFLHSLTFGAAAFLVASGKQGQRTLVQALVAILNVGMNVIVAKPFGIKGISAVYAFTEAVLFLGYFMLARNVIYFKDNKRD